MLYLNSVLLYYSNGAKTKTNQMEKVKITAESVIEFETLEHRYNKLPSQLKDDVKSISMNSLYIEFILKQKFDKVTINVLPGVDSMYINSTGLEFYTSGCKFIYPYESKGGFAVNFLSPPKTPTT